MQAQERLSKQMTLSRLAQAGCLASLTLLAAACSGEKASTDAGEQSPEVSSALQKADEAALRAEAAEAELKKIQDEAQAKLEAEEQAIIAPDWVGEDVSGDSRYFNANLVNHPFSAW